VIRLAKLEDGDAAQRWQVHTWTAGWQSPSSFKLASVSPLARLPASPFSLTALQVLIQSVHGGLVPTEDPQLHTSDLGDFPRWLSLL
jgi:hypothetical protein